MDHGHACEAASNHAGLLGCSPGDQAVHEGQETVRIEILSDRLQFYSSLRLILHCSRGTFFSLIFWKINSLNRFVQSMLIIILKIYTVAFLSSYNLACEPVNYTDDPLAMRVGHFAFYSSF